MRIYKCLQTNIFKTDSFHIEPLRDEDKFEILKIRNEQLYHLRQSEPLTEERQIQYFENVVSKLFDQSQPSQLLFSVFKNNEFIGYGGLVHINWIDKNAEISFVMKTELEQDLFAEMWSNYLKLIEKVAFEDLNFHKIFTYAFDLRPHLYPVLSENGFVEDARLKEHCFFDGKFLDVLIHSKINKEKMHLRKMNSNDAKLLFDWANDVTVRENSINQFPIVWENHLKWFTAKLESTGTNIFILEVKNEPVGQIRFDNINGFWEIDYSIDKDKRGLGYGKLLLKQGMEYFITGKFKAKVKAENIASKKVFLSLGFLAEKTTADLDKTDAVQTFIYEKSNAL